MVNITETKSIDRYYDIAKVLLAATPFICLLYLYMGAVTIGSSIPQAIKEDPRLAVMFLTSMINPFIAYLLTFIHKKIKEADVAYAVVNLMVLILAEVMLQNILYIALLGFLLIKTLKLYQVSIRRCFWQKWKQKFFLTISGSIVVVVLAGICLFSTVRINM